MALTDPLSSLPVQPTAADRTHLRAVESDVPASLDELEFIEMLRNLAGLFDES